MAYGLALQGLKLARLQTNLLPQEIRIERLIRGQEAVGGGRGGGPAAGHRRPGLELRPGVPLRRYRSLAAQGRRHPGHRRHRLCQREAEGLRRPEGRPPTRKRRPSAASSPARTRSSTGSTSTASSATTCRGPTAPTCPPPRSISGGGRARRPRPNDKYRETLANPKPGQRLDTSDIDGDLIQFNIESLDARFSRRPGRLLDQGQDRPGHGEVQGPPGLRVGQHAQGEGHRLGRRAARLHLPHRRPQLRPRSPGRALALRRRPRAGDPRQPAGQPPRCRRRPGDPARYPDPVVGRVSHVVLYKADDTGNDRPPPHRLRRQPDRAPPPPPAGAGGGRRRRPAG